MRTRARDAWQSALEIIKLLRAEGYNALLAGGCVRDRLLQRTPKDYDVATDATPDRVQEFFPRARKVGAKFGVMIVHKDGHDIEVATFRTDGPYSDGRRPDSVVFGTEIEDAKRRDFTINGLFYDPIGDRIIDHVRGRGDLDRRVVRTIGDPDQRFGEDHLRMLRAVRFATRLGFEIEPETADAIRRLAVQLKSISPERVWLELEEVLSVSQRSRGWSLLVETGLRDHLCTHWPQRDSDARVERRLAALPSQTIRPSLGLAAIWCGGIRRDLTRASEALRLSNRLSREVIWLVTSLESVRHEESLEMADLKLLMANAVWPQLLDLLQAELVATESDPSPCERVRRRASSIAAKDVAPEPHLTGNDLCELGLSPGPRMGELIDLLYRAQLNEQIQSREAAMTVATEWIKERS